MNIWRTDKLKAKWRDFSNFSLTTGMAIAKVKDGNDEGDVDRSSS